MVLHTISRSSPHCLRMPAAALRYDPGRDGGESTLIAPLVALGVNLVVVAVAVLAPNERRHCLRVLEGW
jgi:hypothetical protein